MKMHRVVLSASVTAALSLLAVPAFADCSTLPSWSQLRSALVSAVAASNGGLGFNMWATLVANDGTVCAVAFSGNAYTAQWLGSRVISAQKANTANDFSLDAETPATSLFPHGLALSTANLFSAVQPGGSLYGLQHSNPVDTQVAYQGNEGANVDASEFGTTTDPMVGRRIGGVNVFGGGLALYSKGRKVGGVGVSGDTSCADHNVAWRVRNNLDLDQLGAVGGVSGDPKRPDNIVFDITLNPDGGTGISAGGFGHPGGAPPMGGCINWVSANTLPPVH